MNASADNGCGNTGREVAVPDEADARAGFANVRDEFFVAWAIENDYDEIFDVAVETLGDGFEIVGNRGIEIDCASTGGADDNFFHVKIGCVEEAATFAGSENGDGICGTGGAEIGAFERIDGDVNGGENCVGRVRGGADAVAPVEAGRFVAFALPPPHEF